MNSAIMYTPAGLPLTPQYAAFFSGAPVSSSCTQTVFVGWGGAVGVLVIFETTTGVILMSMRRSGVVTGVETVLVHDVVEGSSVSSGTVEQGVEVVDGSGVTTMMVTSDEKPGVLVLPGTETVGVIGSVGGTKTVVLVVDVNVGVSTGVKTVDSDRVRLMGGVSVDDDTPGVMTIAVMTVGEVDVVSGVSVNGVVSGGTTMPVSVSVADDSPGGMTGVDTEGMRGVSTEGVVAVDTVKVSAVDSGGTTTTVVGVPVEDDSPGVRTGVDTDGVNAVDSGGTTTVVGVSVKDGSIGVIPGTDTDGVVSTDGVETVDTVKVRAVDSGGITTTVVGVSTEDDSPGVRIGIDTGVVAVLSPGGIEGVDTITTTVESVPVKDGSPGVVTGTETGVLTLLSTPGVEAVTVDPGGITTNVGVVPVDDSSPGVSPGIKTEIVAVPSPGCVGSEGTIGVVDSEGTPGTDGVTVEDNISDDSPGMITVTLGGKGVSEGDPGVLTDGICTDGTEPDGPGGKDDPGGRTPGVESEAPGGGGIVCVPGTGTVTMDPDTVIVATEGGGSELLTITMTSEGGMSVSPGTETVGSGGGKVGGKVGGSDVVKPSPSGGSVAVT